MALTRTPLDTIILLFLIVLCDFFSIFFLTCRPSGFFCSRSVDLFCRTGAILGNIFSGPSTTLDFSVTVCGGFVDICFGVGVVSVSWRDFLTVTLYFLAPLRSTIFTTLFGHFSFLEAPLFQVNFWYSTAKFFTTLTVNKKSSYVPQQDTEKHSVCA